MTKNTEKFGPNPEQIYPLKNYNRLCFLKNIVKNPDIIIGEYTYYDDFENPENFEKNVLYHFDFIGDKLIIGKFCAIASDVKFIMNGGNHQLDSFSTYPFSIFGEGWEIATPESWPHQGDTIIGNDVWIGYGAVIMPGVKIGDGAVIGTKSIVTKNVEPYSIVGGNPAQLIRKRFTPEIIDILLKLQWWHWTPEKITQHLKVLSGHDLNALRDLIS